MFLGIIGWIVLGLIVGFVASKLVDLRGDDPRLGIAVAAASAPVTAGIYTFISGAGVTALNLWSLAFAAIGGIVGVVIWHSVRSRYSLPGSKTIRRSY